MHQEFLKDNALICRNTGTFHICVILYKHAYTVQYIHSVGMRNQPNVFSSFVDVTITGGNKTFSLSDDVMETEPTRFILCVVKKETVYMKLVTCNLFHATGFLLIRLISIHRMLSLEHFRHFKGD
jgi:hypothetical protein